jgi:hypothetical protein
MNCTYGGINSGKISALYMLETSDWRCTKMTKSIQKCSTSTRISSIRTRSVHVCELVLGKFTFKDSALRSNLHGILMQSYPTVSVFPPSPTTRAQLDPATNASNPTIHDSAAIKDDSLHTSLHIEARPIHHRTLISSCLPQHLKSTMLASTRKPLIGTRIKNM